MEWVHYDLIVPAGTCEEVSLSVAPGHTAQWHFCLDGIAADVGLCVRVCERSRAARPWKPTPEADGKGTERSTGALADDGAKDQLATLLEVPWRGLKATRPRAAVKRD